MVQFDEKTESEMYDDNEMYDDEDEMYDDEDEMYDDTPLLPVPPSVFTAPRSGPRKTVNLLIKILYIFRYNVYAYIENYTNIVSRLISWLLPLENDGDLYNPIYRENLHILIGFLRYPAEKFGKWEVMYVRLVSELEYILQRMPSLDYAALHEQNREFYHELNAYIFKPERVEKIADQFGMEFFEYLDAIEGY